MAGVTVMAKKKAPKSQLKSFSYIRGGGMDIESNDEASLWQHPDGKLTLTLRGTCPFETVTFEVGEEVLQRCDSINFKNETDLNLGLTSFALINIDEFDKTTARQQVLLKYLLSTADVKFRPPYGKAYKQYRRYTSFIGTTNQPKPLTDPTGSRRFVCVEITDLIDFSDTLNHRQFYAQLKQEIANGARYYLNDEEIARLIEENERFQRIDSLAEMLSNLFRKPAADEKGTWWSTTDILSLLQRKYGKSTLKNITPEKIGNTLSRNDFRFESKHSNTGTKYQMIER